MNYNGIDVVMIGEDKQMPEEKKPAKPISSVTKTKKKNHYLIKIIHPNKDSEGVNEVLYEKVHRIKCDSEDVMEQFTVAQDLANEIMETKFSNLETKHEEIKFIPNFKKGKMKLKTKEESEENKVVSKVSKKKVAKKVTRKKKVSKKVTKKVSKVTKRGRKKKKV